MVLDTTPKQPVQTLATPTTADSFEKTNKPHNAVRAGGAIAEVGMQLTSIAFFTGLFIYAQKQDKLQKEKEGLLLKRIDQLEEIERKQQEQLNSPENSATKNNVTVTSNKPDVVSNSKPRQGIGDPFSWGAITGALTHYVGPKLWKIIEAKIEGNALDAEALKALKAAKVAYNLAETHYSPTEKAKLYTEAINKFETAIVSIKDTHPDIAVLAKGTQLSAYIKHGDYNEQAIKTAAQQVKDLMQEVYAPSYEYKGIVVSSNYNPINDYLAKECYPTTPKKDNHYWTNANPLETYKWHFPSPEFKEQMTLRNNAIDAYKMKAYLFDGTEGVHYELFTRNDNSVLNVVNKILKPDYYIPTEVIFRHTLGYDDKLQSTFGRIDDSGLGRISEVIFDAKKSPNWVLPQKTTPALQIGGKYCSPDDLRELYYGAQKNKDNIRVLQGTAKRNSPSEWGYYVK